MTQDDRGPARIPNSADCSNSEETPVLPGDCGWQGGSVKEGGLSRGD